MSKEVLALERLGSRDQINEAFDHAVKHSVKNQYPLISKDTVNFFYYSETADHVLLSGDLSNWEPTIPMKRIGQSDVFYYCTTLPLDARIEYKVVINNKWELDPYNDRKTRGEFVNSFFEMPNYTQNPLIDYRSPIPRGRIDNYDFYSDAFDRSIDIKVYTPPYYRQDTTKNYPVVFFQDGLNQIDLAATHIIIDHLIQDKRMEPVIGVFYDPDKRTKEYAGDDRMKTVECFGNEIYPKMISNFRVLEGAENSALIGASFGANISVLIAESFPDKFGKVGAHSGAYHTNDFEVSRKLKAGKLAGTEYAAIWGTYERWAEDNRSITKVLEAKNQGTLNKEYPEGHNWALWQKTMNEFLEIFFPYKK